MSPYHTIPYWEARRGTEERDTRRCCRSGTRRADCGWKGTGCLKVGSSWLHVGGGYCIARKRNKTRCTCQHGHRNGFRRGEAEAQCDKSGRTRLNAWITAALLREVEQLGRTGDFLSARGLRPSSQPGRPCRVLTVQLLVFSCISCGPCGILAQAVFFSNDEHCRADFSSEFIAGKKVEGKFKFTRSIRQGRVQAPALWLMLTKHSLCDVEKGRKMRSTSRRKTSHMHYLLVAGNCWVVSLSKGYSR